EDRPRDREQPASFFLESSEVERQERRDRQQAEHPDLHGLRDRGDGEEENEVDEPRVHRPPEASSSWGPTGIHEIARLSWSCSARRKAQAFCSLRRHAHHASAPKTTEEISRATTCCRVSGVST